MKAASESIRFMKRMNTVAMMNLDMVPEGHYEVEVYEEEEEEKSRQGEGLADLGMSKVTRVDTACYLGQRSPRQTLHDN